MVEMSAQAAEVGYEHIFEAFSDGVLITDRDGRFVDANRLAVDLLGMQRAELLQRSAIDVLFGSAPKPAEAYERFLTQGHWQGIREIASGSRMRSSVRVDAKTISTPEGGVLCVYVIKSVREHPSPDLDLLGAGDPLFSTSSGWRIPWPIAALCALGLVGAVTGLAWLLPHHGPGTPTTLYLLAIFAASQMFGGRSGILASVAALILLDYLFLPPLSTFGTSDPSDAALLAVFFLAALLASWIPVRFRAVRSRAMAERDRAAAMVTIVASLAQARSVQAVGASVVHVAAAALGAKASAVYLLTSDRQHLQLVLGEGYPASIAERWARFPIDAEVPVADAVRTGKEVLLGSISERVARYAISRDRPSMGPGSLAALPLYANDTVVGALTFNFAHDHRFEPLDVEFLRAFALTSAQTLERARLEENDARLRERAALVAAASEALVGSLDRTEILQQVAQLAVPGFADWAAVDVLEDHGRIELVAVAHRDPDMVRWAWEMRARSPALLSDGTGVGQVIRTRQVAFYPELHQADLEQQAETEDKLEVIRRLAIRSVIIVPLIARDTVLGALTLINAESERHYDREDVRVAQDIASRAAIVIDNAKLFQERDRIARSLQEILLPASLPSVPGFELAAIYQAGSEGMDVGGDFYDVFRRTESSFGVAIGDVCGHGPEAAAVMGVARQTIRVAGMTAVRPSAILRVLNESLVRGAYERFVTVADVRVRHQSGRAELSVCLAGHPLPMLLRADGEVHPVGEPGTLLGMFEDVNLTDSPAEMAPGDALVLFTDGLLEWPSRREVDGDFRQLLASLCGSSAEEIVRAVERWWRDGTKGYARDDVAVLVVRFLGQSDG